MELSLSNINSCVNGEIVGDKNLMISEANHYTTFLQFARQYQNREIVDEKWNALLAFEAEMMRERGQVAKIHG